MIFQGGTTGGRNRGKKKIPEKKRRSKKKPKFYLSRSFFHFKRWYHNFVRFFLFVVFQLIHLSKDIEDFISRYNIIYDFNKCIPYFEQVYFDILVPINIHSDIVRERGSLSYISRWRILLEIARQSMLFMEASRNIKFQREKKKWIKGDLEKSQPRARAFFYAYFKPFFYV